MCFHIQGARKFIKVSFFYSNLFKSSEEELFMILLDIMRSPETIKSLTGSSLKKTLDEDNE